MENAQTQPDPTVEAIASCFYARFRQGRMGDEWEKQSPGFRKDYRANVRKVLEAAEVMGFQLVKAEGR